MKKEFLQELISSKRTDMLYAQLGEVSLLFHEVNKALRDIVPGILANLDDWVGCGVVAAVDEEERLVGIKTVYPNLARQFSNAPNYWLMRKPAINKALTRRALDISGVNGGVAENWEMLKQRADYQYHSGDAVTIVANDRKVYLGATLAMMMPRHIDRQVEKANDPWVTKKHEEISGDRWEQAGFGDTLLAWMVASQLGEPVGPMPVITRAHWDANS